MSQGQFLIPTTPPLPGATLVGDLNTAIGALLTSSSGSTAPTAGAGAGGTLVLGQPWLNTATTPYTLCTYDGAQWVVEGFYDPTNHQFYGPVGGGLASLASASTVDLGSVPQSQITITGTTAITSFGTSALKGTVKFVTFAGALTLTYNSTSMILPGGASITTAAGDTLVAIAQGGGNWIVWNYTLAAGSGGGGGGGAWTKLTISSHSASYSLLSSDVGVWQYFTGSSAATFTLPSSPATGFVLLVRNAGTAALTLSGNGNTIEGASSVVLQPGMGGNWVWSGSTWQPLFTQTPAFYSYLTTSISSPTFGAWAKVGLDTVAYDTSGSWSTSNKRFQPNVPGLYQVTASANLQTNAAANVGVAIYKNGAVYQSWLLYNAGTSNMFFGPQAAVPLNGGTDYLELYYYMATGTTGYVYGGQQTTYLTAYRL